MKVFSEARMITSDMSLCNDDDVIYPLSSKGSVSSTVAYCNLQDASRTDCWKVWRDETVLNTL